MRKARKKPSLKSGSTTATAALGKTEKLQATTKTSRCDLCLFHADGLGCAVAPFPHRITA